MKRNGYYVQRLPVVSCLLGSHSWHEAQRVIKNAKPKRGAEGKKHKSLPPPSLSFLWIKLQGFRGLRTYPPAHLSLLFAANLQISHTRNFPDIQPSQAGESTSKCFTSDRIFTMLHIHIINNVICHCKRSFISIILLVLY